jgi:hypothetical protein
MRQHGFLEVLNDEATVIVEALKCLKHECQNIGARYSLTDKEILENDDKIRICDRLIAILEEPKP